ncbi:leukotriene C4 synthase isoform X3 [Camelus dromedarius]
MIQEQSPPGDSCPETCQPLFLHTLGGAGTLGVSDTGQSRRRPGTGGPFGRTLKGSRDERGVAYFSLQVISARRAFRVSPPLTTGPPEFERVYRAQVNCSEYFPLFLATLWVAGIFFHEGAAALCGLVYLFARLRYFQGYARSAQQR